ncbi:MAG TPA: hypothetical protein VLV86_20945 [Vicinamibacterales bacterium]|nr:hypothetical protein [Vicinamibacterales bacterium]
MRTRAVLAAACWCVLAGGHKIDSNELLKVQISPLVAPAPALITVRTVVDVNDDNRALEVVAESPDFARRSSIELNRLSPRVNVFDFANLPAGKYEISAALIGTNGVRATMARTVLIMATPVARR